MTLTSLRYHQLTIVALSSLHYQYIIVVIPSSHLSRHIIIIFIITSSVHHRHYISMLIPSLSCGYGKDGQHNNFCQTKFIYYCNWKHFDVLFFNSFSYSFCSSKSRIMQPFSGDIINGTTTITLPQLPSVSQLGY